MPRIHQPLLDSPSTSSHMSAQDPDELFDVLTADGTATGMTKARHAVHRDGDWHRSLHVWVTGIADDGVPFLLLQRRGIEKDTWPGALDTTVGGHFRTGEALEQVVREVEEEIGVAVTPRNLRWLGTRVSVCDMPSLGIADRELQEVFLLRDDRPLESYHPNADEVMELVRVSLPALLPMLAGDTEQALAALLEASSGTVSQGEITRDGFVATIDAYVYRVAIAAGLVLGGERHVAI
jgi:isopentenyldiphosphate isomerase